MTKRQLENEIDELSDEVLTDLSPSERLQLVFEAEANGRDGWTDRLVDTCPRYHYRSTDRAFTERARSALLFGQHALYRLHTTWLQYEYVTTRQRLTAALAIMRDDDFDAEVNDDVADCADQVNGLFGELYTAYHAHRQFADAVLGVDIETWVGRYPDGDLVMDGVKDTLDDSLAVEMTEDWLNGDLDRSDDGVTDDAVAADADELTDRVTLEELTELRFEGLQELWHETIAEIED